MVRARVENGYRPQPGKSRQTERAICTEPRVPLLVTIHSSWQVMSQGDGPRASAIEWHDGGMSRTRLSTTVDADLLRTARKMSGKPDSVLVDEALTALLAGHRAAEVDASYTVYDEHPLEEPDEWGDLASFRRAVGAS